MMEVGDRPRFGDHRDGAERPCSARDVPPPLAIAAVAHLVRPLASNKVGVHFNPPHTIGAELRECSNRHRLPRIVHLTGHRPRHQVH